MKTAIGIFSTLAAILAVFSFVAYIEIKQNTYNVANFNISKDSSNLYVTFNIVIFNNSFLSITIGSYSLNVMSGTVNLGAVTSSGASIGSNTTTTIPNSLTVALSTISLTSLLSLGNITISGNVPIKILGITVYNYPLSITEPLSSLL